MLRLLAVKFVPAGEDTEPAVRSAWGTLCGAVGIFLNLVLFTGKLLAGLLSGSIAITADAFNNLSDAFSSVVTLLGFRLASKKPDPDHPFGHGRMEYLSGLVVSFAILLMGFELAKSAVEKIFKGGEAEFSLLSFIILGAAVLVKMYMWFYNRTVAARIDSAAMRATARDSLSDAVSTSAVLVSVLIAKLTGLDLDGYIGAAVSLLVLYTGISSVKDTIDPLLGMAPDPAFVRRVTEIVKQYPDAVGIHDMIIHDYGPGRVMLSLHVEVPGNRNIFELHDVIDTIEGDLRRELSCEAVIHMDPVVTDDEAVKSAKHRVAEAVRAFDPSCSIHDFRMVSGPTHTNVIFDVVVPFSCTRTDEETAVGVKEAVNRLDETWFAVVKVEKDYLGQA